MKTKRTLASFALILGIVAIATTLWVQRDSDKAGRIRIMDPLEANNLHIAVAESIGSFRRNGLDVVVSGTSAGKFAMDALNGGAVDYAVVVEMNVVSTLFHSDDIVILADLSGPGRTLQMLARSDHGVSTPDDLRGKRIGVLFGVNIHIHAQRFLASHGIDQESVTLVNLRPPDAVAAFKAGDVDAIVIWQPHVQSIKRALGERVVVLSDDPGKYWTFRMVLVTKRSRAERYPAEVDAVLRSVVEADRFIHESPSEARKILARRINLELSDVLAFWNDLRFDIKSPSGLRAMMEHELDWLQRSFFRDRAPKVSDVGVVLSPALDLLEASGAGSR